jgi:hypothetical protein
MGRKKFSKVYKKEGDKMAELAYQTSSSSIREKLMELKEKATIRKSRKDLRHIPNEHDVATANENSRIMMVAQCLTLKNK